MNIEQCIETLEQMGVPFDKIWLELANNKDNWYPDDLVTIFSNMLVGLNKKGNVQIKDGVSTLVLERPIQFLQNEVVEPQKFLLTVNNTDPKKVLIELTPDTNNILKKINLLSALEIQFYDESVYSSEEFGTTDIGGKTAFILRQPTIEGENLINKITVGLFGINPNHGNPNNGVFVEYIMLNENLTNNILEQIKNEISTTPIYKTIDNAIANIELTNEECLWRIFNTHSFPVLEYPISCYDFDFETNEYVEVPIEYKNTETFFEPNFVSNLDIPDPTKLYYNFPEENRREVPINYSTKENDLISYLENFIQGEKIIDDIKRDFKNRNSNKKI